MKSQSPSKRQPSATPGKVAARTFTLLWSFLTIFLVMFEPLVAAANCGSSASPSYSDIDAILLNQNGCDSAIQEPDTAKQLRVVSTLRCSTFWILFWDPGRGAIPTTYSQYSLRNSIGTFHLSISLDDARHVLEKHSFFTVSSSEGFVTDAARSTLAVRRCGVVTIVKSYNTALSRDDLAIHNVIEEFRALITVARAKRISSAATGFLETGLFDL
jgi:hypothetical protein